MELIIVLGDVGKKPSWIPRICIPLIIRAPSKFTPNVRLCRVPALNSSFDIPTNRK